MKNLLVVFCLIVTLASNMFSQQFESKFNMKVDTGYINVDGGKLFYEIAGEGDFIVLLHDGILHREIWDGQFPMLATSHRVVRYDRREYGKSTMPLAPFSDIDDLNQLFTQLKIDKAMIFGMSAGGGLAIDFTLKYPEKIEALVLVGAVVSGYGYTSHMTNRGGHISSIADILEPQKFIKYFGWDDPYEVYPENIQAKEKFYKLLQANPQNVTGALDYFQKPPERPAAKYLSEIKVPALVLVGEFDIPDVHAHSGVIESGIPNAKREIILKAGHLIPLEQPEAFNTSVLTFFSSFEFDKILNSGGTEAAVKYFMALHETKPDMIIFTEARMNLLGYRYLQAGKIGDAIELFKMNTIAYPNSANTYDSLGEAYMNAGDKELAIKNYEKSLELNSQNTNAVEQLKKLETK